MKNKHPSKQASYPGELSGSSSYAFINQGIIPSTENFKPAYGSRSSSKPLVVMKTLEQCVAEIDAICK
ncbi:hypothetical protein KA107_03530 [Candidatus Pacearchaeota archaeon]|nr:hypothetical protein [Candidatus Pacearchaeota archaeon]